VIALDTGDAAQARKRVALGAVPGCEVELERRAPAFVLRLGRTTLAIDEALARSVVVRAQ
jgi:Fe2+ transport system protein FeoA